MAETVISSVTNHATKREEIASVFGDAAKATAAAGADDRVAIVLLDPLALIDYADYDGARPNTTLIRGRDDLDALQYSRRSVILSAAEYVAGLQFAVVIVAGFPDDSNKTAHLGYQQRRLLSLLYLAVSRATKVVAIHVNAEKAASRRCVRRASEAKILAVDPQS